MNIELIVFAVLSLIISFWTAEAFDAELPIDNESYKRHTIRLKPPLKNIFFLKDKKHRTRFAKIAVIYEVIAYIISLSVIVLAFFVKEKETVHTIITAGLYVDAAVLLFTVIPFGIYFECKQVKFIIHTPQFKRKSLKEKILSLFFSSKDH